MSRENEPASAIPPKQQPQGAREKNVTVFKNFKHRLGSYLHTDLDKWLKVMQTFRDFVRDARIYYDEARPDIVDCVDIATSAVVKLLPTELQHVRPVVREYFPEPYRVTYDEIKRLLVTVGSYQPEIVSPHRGGEPRNDLLSKLTVCIAAFGISPESLLDKTALEATMRAVSLDAKSQQTIFASIARRRPDTLSALSSRRSTPSISTPALSLPSPHTSSSPQVVAPVTPIVPSAPAPVPNHVRAVHPPPQAQGHAPAATVPTQAKPPPVVSNPVASPTQPAPPAASKPRKRQWMMRDLDEFREGKKLAKSSATPVSPATPTPTSISVAPSQHSSIAAPVQTAIVSPSPIQPSDTQVVPSISTTTIGPSESTSSVPEHAIEPEDDANDSMEVDAPPVDGDAPLPYALPEGPYGPGIPTATWAELFADAITSANGHKLAITQMIQYVSTVYPGLGLKSIKLAAGTMFNSRAAKQSGKATLLHGMVGDELRIKHSSKGYTGPRFVRVSNVFPHEWTTEELLKTLSATPALPDTAAQPSDQPEEVTADKSTALHSGKTRSSAARDATPEGTKSTATINGANGPIEDTPMLDSTKSALPYTLPPSPYLPTKPSKALPVLIQEAILAGTPEKCLSQADIISYIRTSFPFYASYPDLESEVSPLLQQHFAPQGDGPDTKWSLWIRDGSDEARPLPATLPSGPRLSTKPDRPLRSFIHEAILASPEGRLTQRDVAAYVLSVAPYYNGADESLPFAQLLREHFVQRGLDSEGHALWGIKDDEEPPKDDGHAPASGEPVLVEDVIPTEAPPISPIVAMESKPLSTRPTKRKGPPKSAAVVDSDEDEQSDLEEPDAFMHSPITPLSAGAAIPSPVEVPPTDAPRKASKRSTPLATQPYVLPPGPYSSHKPPKSNDALIIEALLASPTRQLQKKDIVAYLRTVYPWFQRDERALQGCKKMVESQVNRLGAKEWVTRLGKGLWALQNTARTSVTPSVVSHPQSEAEDEPMDDVMESSTPKSTGSPVLKIRIPARPPVSGDASSAVSQKRSALSSSPGRSASPSLPKKIKLIVRDKTGAISPPGGQTNGNAAPKAPDTSSTASAPEPKNGVHALVRSVVGDEAAVPSTEQGVDVEMKDSTEVVKVPELPPLPPVSFGSDAYLVDVAFGSSTATSFALHVHPYPEQWEMLERWRNAARNDDDVSQALCYSLVCYRSEDVHLLREDVAADAWANALARTEIPVSLHNEALRSLCLTGNSRTVPFPLTWMAAAASPLFLDISSYLVSGENLLTFTHTSDLSAFAFAIVAHRPNAHQLRWLDARREPWRRFQAQLDQSLQIPQFDYNALLLSSKDVSGVDLNRVVSQELLTIS